MPLFSRSRQICFGLGRIEYNACYSFMATRRTAKSPSPGSGKKSPSSSPGGVWAPPNCTPLCSGSSGCSYSGKHHELIMSLMKCANNAETEKTEFKKALDKFAKTKWLRRDCVPDKNVEIRFPLIHWACILGKYKVLEYLVSEKDFELTVKTGKNQEGPLFSMVQNFSRGVDPKSSFRYIESMLGQVLEVFLKYMPEALCEKETNNDDSILHCCARRCSSDTCSRALLKVLLLKIKESDKFTAEKEENFLLAVNKKGDTFLHLMVADEKSAETLNYLVRNFVSASEKLSKTKNNQGKTPRQIAVEERSFEMLKGLGAPDIVINSLKKAVSSGNPPKISYTAKKSSQQKETGSAKSTAKTSSQVNGVLSDKDTNQSPETSSVEQTPVQEAKITSPGGQQEVRVIDADELQTEGLKMCSCDPPVAEVTEQPTDCNTPTKRTIEPFPQRYPAKDVTTTTPEKPNATTETTTKNNANTSSSSATEEDKMGVENIDSTPDLLDGKDTDHTPLDNNAFLSLSNAASSLFKGEPLKSSQKRPAPGVGSSRGPNRKRVRIADVSSESESDVEEDADFVLDDDSDDDIESAEEEEGDEEEEEEEEDLEDEEKKENTDVGNDQQKEKEKEARDVQLDETEMEIEGAPKHTPFCRSDCTSHHHRLLLSLLKCSNYNYGSAMAYLDSFMKQVHEYVNQPGKCSDVLANADLPDRVAFFQYPLVHWACVLGKFKVLERLAAMKEFNLGVRSERTGETGLHRMLMSLDQAMVRKKSPNKTILEVFSKTLRTLTENLPRLITICNKEGDTPFHCLAKVILDSTGELERMNMYEGYFGCLVKELTRLRSTGKLTPDVVRELLLKTNNSQETFLHILACRHGVGHRVIKSVLKNIDPEIMEVLKETVDAQGKTPSNLAEDLCSFEMAAILRPRDQDWSNVGDNDGPVEEHPEDELPEDELPLKDLLQTPEKDAPPDSDSIHSPPATLFHPLEYAMSPVIPDGAAARVRLFSVKKEPGEGGHLAAPSRESPVVVNNSPCPSDVSGNTSLPPVVKTSPGKANSTSLPPAEDGMVASTSLSASGNSANITEASTTNHIRASNVAHPTANQSKSNGEESSILPGMGTMPQSEKKNFLNSLHAKFQQELVQARRGLNEKEDALAHVRQRIANIEKRKQNLLQELRETWDEMAEATRDEGVLQAEITAKKSDCEKFQAELTKYEASLKVIGEQLVEKA